jgi:hypothetical protein
MEGLRQIQNTIDRPEGIQTEVIARSLQYAQQHRYTLN